MKAYAYFQQHDGSVEFVATVDISEWMDTNEALEYVYHSLQNICGSWSFGPHFEGCNDPAREGQSNRDHSPDVTFFGEHPQDDKGRTLGERSMMIGDLITFDGKTYEVDFVGFKEYVEEAA